MKRRTKGRSFAVTVWRTAGASSRSLRRCSRTSALVIEALKQVFDHEAEARVQQMSAAAFSHHQHDSGPLMDGLKHWLEQHSRTAPWSLIAVWAKLAIYLLGHWPTLTRFLEACYAPLDNNTVERALKLFIRQRKNSLFYATEHSAYIASLLTSLIATCIQASGERAGVPGGAPGAPPGGLSSPSSVAAMELSRPSGPALGHWSPILSHPGVVGIPIPQQHQQLAGTEARARVLALGPPWKRPGTSVWHTAKSPVRRRTGA